jgi:hypothetical protein
MRDGVRSLACRLSAGGIRASEARRPAIDSDCSFREHILGLIGCSCSIEHAAFAPFDQDDS